jgi:hypothetical protein
MEKWTCSKVVKSSKQKIKTKVCDSFDEANHLATLLLNDLGEEGRKDYCALLEPILEGSQ